jgi:hypothetical protein
MLNRLQNGAGVSINNGEFTIANGPVDRQRNGLTWLVAATLKRRNTDLPNLHDANYPSDGTGLARGERATAMSAHVTI